MNPKSTIRWIIVAAALFAFIFFFERHIRKPETGPAKVLPGLLAGDINSLQILPRGQLPIHAKRINGVWRLTEPLDYPARTNRIETLLAALETLTATFIPPEELKALPDTNDRFGFDPPQFSITIDQRKYLMQIGRNTAPGDQIFVEVVGNDGVYVADAELLKLIPRTAADWRDTRLVDWSQVMFNRLTVTNAGKVFELQIDPTNKLWRTSGSMDTRADRGRIEAALVQLQKLRAQQFTSDDPKPDLETFGLQTPELSLTFAQGTNVVLLLEFGKSPGTNTALAYARRTDQNTIITVPKDCFRPWLASQSDNFRDFLDRHLMTFTTPPDSIEIRAQDDFTLQRQTNGGWRVVPQNFPADSALVEEFIGNLTNLQAAEIVTDVVSERDLPAYGLATPARQYIFKTATAFPSDGSTNLLVTQLDFGTNQDKVFARRAGEGFVYSINPTNLAWLPDGSLKMRERRIWNFSENDAARITVQQGGKKRELVRKGKDSWTFAPGSQGIIDEIQSAAIQETVHRLGELSAAFWVERGDQHRDNYGFTQTDHELTIELVSGEKFTVAFGSTAPSNFPYATVVLDGEPWIFEFPWTTYQFIQLYLSIPANAP
jgi:Domain of unknown function (DUF4340)